MNPQDDNSYRRRSQQPSYRRRSSQQRQGSAGRQPARQLQRSSAEPGYRRRSESTAQYRRENYQHRSSHRAPQQPSRKPPVGIIIGIAALIVIVLVIVLSVRGCSAGQNTTGEAAVTSGQVATQAASGTTASAAAASADQIVMTLGGDEDTQVLKGEDYLEAGCHAVDKTDGDITSSVTTSGEVDTSKAGDYTVTYTATNSAGAQASRTRTVHVVSKMDADTDGISVMMYHYVYKSGNPPEENSNNYISTKKLAAQLKWLVKNDYYFPSYQELRGYIDGTHSLPKKSVVLTFDDGEKGFLKYGIALLEKYKVPATSFIICDRSTAKGKIKKYASEYVTFQSHSYSLHNAGHNNIGRGGRIYDLSTSELVADIKKAQKILGTTEAFAYPFGDVSDVAPAAMKKAGVLCAFTINYDQVHKGDDPTQLSRIRVFGDGALAGFIYQVQHGQG